MSETGSALRATSDAVLADLEELEILERRKREMEPGAEQTLQLARRVEDIARRLLGETVTQRQLSTVARDLVQRGSAAAPDAPIEETPREIHLILADWRDAERRATTAAPGSREATGAQRDIDRFRREYRAAHEHVRGD